MKPKFTLAFALILATLTPPGILPADAQLSSDTRAVIAANTSFALNLYAKLKTADGNLFFSPYSISTALAMTYGGARGQTAQQMADTLGFAAIPTNRLPMAFHTLKAELDTIQKGGTVQLNIANSLWPQKNYPFHQIGRYSVPSTFLDSYLDLCKKYYGVTITPVDYKGNKEAACQTINQWVEEQTQRKITDLIRPEALNSQTRLMLVNAIYFKGRWSSQFQPGATSEEVFHVTPRQDAKCQMMFQQKTFEYAETTDLQMLKLPYVSNDLFMLILLPKKTDGIGALENNLSAEKLTEWIGSLKDQEVEVQLPKFTQTSTFSLAETLKNLGMTLAFEDKADFSGMDGHTHWLFISAVAHKAYVDVNEGGTEAAAATAVEMEAGAEAPREVPVFQADHPFIFLIMDKNTGSLLFMGRVITPAVY